MAQIVVNLAVEDDVSEAVGLRLLSSAGKSLVPGIIYKRNGYGYLRANLRKFNSLAKISPVLLLTDLDSSPCASHLIQNWFGRQRRNPALIFRVAIREAEAWLMADRSAFADWLRIDAHLLSRSIEKVADPKSELIRLAEKSPDAKLRRRLCPATGTSARQGPLFNATVTEFARTTWDPKRASKNTQSLARAILALNMLALGRRT